ncbi:MAG: hypothetical protein KJ799_01940 [Bacteroidetes bacterium]|nr:hypothetical protein [Bacteroidota bacterium]MBU1677298.1 hypothetical protein [Bacteroidota bacterium]MBU2505474.1 hypothetical protein [Bacteroidota bacterium]
MNRKILTLIVIGISAVIIASVLLWLYVINIYEVKINLSSNSLIADDNSTITVEVVPLNSFGKRALGRVSKADFFIEEGHELVEILSGERNSQTLKLRAKSQPGRVIILIKSEDSLLPAKIVIPVEKNKKENYS